MPTILDDALVPVALDLIDTLGQSATFYVPGTKEFDPETNEVTEEDVDEISRKISPPSPYDVKYIDGDIVRANDLQAYVAGSGLTFVPVLGMKVGLIDGTTWQIVRSEPLYSGELIAAYRLQMRK